MVFIPLKTESEKDVLARTLSEKIAEGDLKVE
jgi:hypothetical protein